MVGKWWNDTLHCQSRIIRGVLGVWAIGVCAVAPIDAQQNQQAVAEAHLVGTAVANVQRLPRISVQLDNVPMRVAVSAIAKQANLRVSYNISVIPESARVTVHATDVSVMEVFRQALAGTNLVADIQMTGNVLIYREPGKILQDGIVAGAVMDAATKRPVAGARISVGDSEHQVMTDAQGAFRLVVTPGEHTIQIRAMGYGRETRRITVANGQTLSLEFLLESTANVLEQVVVTSAVVATERKAIPTPITVITAEEIERRGITRIEQLLRGEVPGVIAIESGSLNYQAGTVPNVSFGYMTSSSIYTRGSAGLGNSNGGGTTSPLKTYVDGVEILSPSYLGTIDPASIERIEIVTGPQASTIYGSEAIGGVMQIFTKKGDANTPLDVTMNARFGILESNLSSGKTPTHNHSLSFAGSSGASLSYSGTLSYTYSGQWQPGLFARRYGASIGVTHIRGPVTVTGTVATTSAVNGTTSNPAILTRVYRETGEWTAPSGTGDFMARRTNESRTQTLSLRTDYRPLPWWQHQLTIGRSQTDLAITPSAPRNFTPADTLWGGGTQYGSRLSWNYNTTAISGSWNHLSSTLTVGGDGSRGKSTMSSGCRATPSASAYIGCTARTAPRVTEPLSDKRWGLFGRGQVGVWDQLFVTGGVRGERNPNYGAAHGIDWTPTVGVTYTFSLGDLTVKMLGSYGRSTRSPAPSYRDQQFSVCSFCNPRDYLGRLESPELRPEYSRGPQGGIELYYGNLGSLTINRYRQTISDLIELVVVDSVVVQRLINPIGPYTLLQRQYLNTAGVRQQGWEGTGKLNIRSLSLKGTWSWNDSRVAYVVDPNRSVGLITPGNVFNGVPSHTVHMAATYAAGRTSATFVSNYVGPTLQVWNQSMRYQDRTSARIPTYLEMYRTYNVQWRKAGYIKSDIALSHRIASNVSLIANIINLGNSYGTDVSPLYPALGRQTSFGVTIKN